jgi:hypothetical protein
MASSQKELSPEQYQDQLLRQLELEHKFGADATALVNKAIADNVPYPSVVYQLDEILFDLKYKNRKLADLRTDVLKQAIVAARASDIPKLKGK